MVSLALLMFGLYGIFNPNKYAMISLETPTSVVYQAQTITEYETKNIEDIRENDEVLAYDVRTGEVTKRKVTQVFKRQADHIRYLTIRGENGVQQIVKTTDNHAFWVVTDQPDWSRVASENVLVEDVGSESFILHHDDIAVSNSGFYVEAGKLRNGDKFLDDNDNTLTLLETYRVDYPDGITVYNFTVEDDHNYFVIANYEAFQNGAQPVLVHNSNCDSRILAKNMQDTGTYRYGKQAAHHIVSGNPRELETARNILAKHKIDINSHWNGVYLPRQKNMQGTYHNGGHSSQYYTMVNDMIVEADKKGGKTGVLNALQKIRQGLANGNIPL
jgi:hypothetical protein